MIVETAKEGLAEIEEMSELGYADVKARDLEGHVVNPSTLMVDAEKPIKLLRKAAGVTVAALRYVIGSSRTR